MTFGGGMVLDSTLGSSGVLSAWQGEMPAGEVSSDDKRDQLHVYLLEALEDVCQTT